MALMSITELKANRSKAIARAEEGETIEITRHGKIVVELSPILRANRNVVADPFG